MVLDVCAVAISAALMAQLAHQLNTTMSTVARNQSLTNAPAGGPGQAPALLVSTSNALVLIVCAVAISAALMAQLARQQGITMSMVAQLQRCTTAPVRHCSRNLKRVAAGAGVHPRSFARFMSTSSALTVLDVCAVATSAALMAQLAHQRNTTMSMVAKNQRRTIAPGVWPQAPALLVITSSALTVLGSCAVAISAALMAQLAHQQGITMSMDAQNQSRTTAPHELPCGSKCRR